MLIQIWNKLNSENEVEEHIEYENASFDEQESECESFCINTRKRKNAADTCPDKAVKGVRNKKKVVAKPNEKISVARTQLQATLSKQIFACIYFSETKKIAFCVY